MLTGSTLEENGGQAAHCCSDAVQAMRSRRHRIRNKEINLSALEVCLTRVTALCLSLLVVCQLFLAHPYGRGLLPFIDAPEGQQWPALSYRRGWIRLTADPPAGVRVIVNSEAVGDLHGGSLTLQVNSGDRLLLSLAEGPPATTVRVSASHGVRFPARGAWIRIDPGEDVYWGACQVHK